MGKGHVSPVYVDDLVEGVMRAAAQPEGAGQAFTLTGGVGVETRDYFGRYARMVGKKVPVAPTPVVLALAATLGRTSDEVTPDGVRYLARKGTYSIEKARSLLGYEPAVDLDEGMRRSEEWLRARRGTRRRRPPGAGRRASPSADQLTPAGQHRLRRSRRIR